MLDQDLHHDVLELDVHDCSDRLLLGPQQRGTENHAQVGHRHQVLLLVLGYAGGQR